MDHVPSLRTEFIPFGACVTPHENGGDLPELFAQIDGGSGDATQLALAKEACLTCVQLDFCAPQRTEVAEELWQRGAGLAIVGGEQVTLAANERLSSDAFAALKFDISRVPSDPETRLAVYRQAVRAEQLTSLATEPRAVASEREHYMQWLTESDTALLAALNTEVGSEELAKGIKYIVGAIYQQREYNTRTQQYSRGRPYAVGNYLPGTINPELDYPFVTHYLRDVLAVRRQDITEASSCALRYPPAYYERLARTYKVPYSIPDTNFTDIVDGNLKDPEKALQQYVARYERALDNPAVSATTARAAARNNKFIDPKEIAALKSRYQQAPYITEGVVLSAYASSRNPEKALDELVHRVTLGYDICGADSSVPQADIVAFAKTHRSDETFTTALAQHSDNIHTLEQRYRGNEHFNAGTIRRISRAHPTNATRAASDYLACVDALLAQADGSVAISKIRKYALVGEHSYEAVKRLSRQDTLKHRFAERARRQSTIAVQSWAIERITHLYPNAQQDSIAEDVYTLLNSGVLVAGRADSPSTRDENYQSELDKIFVPGKREYLTFTDKLLTLTPIERLALAHYYNLMPLLYGAEPDQLRLEQSFLPYNSLEVLIADSLWPRCQELLGTSTNTAIAALPSHQLSQDLLVFKKLLGDSNEPTASLPEHGLNMATFKETIVVVGGATLPLNSAEATAEWASMDAAMRAWLEQKMATHYPPTLYAQAVEHLKAALDSGLLIVTGTSPVEYRLVFGDAFYAEGVTELDRAAFANAISLDRAVYGRDLSLHLEHRLNPHESAMRIQRGAPTILPAPTETTAVQVENPPPNEVSSPPTPELSPFEQLVLRLYGEQPHLAHITPEQQQKVVQELMSTFSSYIENSNHSMRMKGSEKAVFLAWQSLLQNDVDAAADRFSIVPAEISQHVQAGLELIISLLSEVSERRQRVAKGILASVVAPPPPTSQATTRTKRTRKTTPKRPSAVARTATTSPVQPAAEPAEPDYFDQPETIKTDSQPEDGYDEDFKDLDLLARYMHDIRRIKLLSAKEEVELAHAIEAGLFAHEKLTLGALPSQEHDLQRLVAIGEAAKKRMIESNLRLVVSITKSYQGRGLAFLDLIQEGNKGLIRAVEKFDYVKGYKFSTYATWWIRQAVERALGDTARTIRLPINIGQLAGKIARFKRDFVLEHQVEPTPEQIARELDLKVARIEEVQKFFGQVPVSFQTLIGDDQTSELGDLIEDTNAIDPLTNAVNTLTYEALCNALKRLAKDTRVDERTAAVLAIRFGVGLDNRDIIDATLAKKLPPMTDDLQIRDKIGEVFGVTRERIRQIELAGLKLLKTAEYTDHLS